MRNELAQAIKEIFRDRAFSNSHEPVNLTGEYDLHGYLIRIEALVKKIAKCKGEVFSVEGIRNNDECMKYYKTILPFIKATYIEDMRPKSALAREITSSFPFYDLNPYANLFMERIDALAEKIYPIFSFDRSYPGNKDKLIKLVGILNEFSDSIKSDAKTPEFKKTINDFKRLIRKNTESAEKYIDYMFEKHSRLLIVRLDIEYNEDNNGLQFRNKEELEHGMMIAKDDFNNFMDKKKANGLFDHLLGHIWKLEFTHLTGFHYHLILMFDSSKVRQDYTIGDMLGEYWKMMITEGRGRYFNCNRPDNQIKYKKLGIGVISRGDIELRDNLKQIVGYLTKADYYGRMIAPNKWHTFGRGEILQSKTSKTKTKQRKYSEIGSASLSAPGMC